MTRPLPLCLAVILSTLPLAASAQDFGASLGLELGRNTQRSENFKRIESRFAIDFASRWGLQVDVAAAKYEGATSTAPSGAFHLTYAASPDWTLGVYIAGDDLRPGNYVYYGIEAAYDGPRLSVDFNAAAIDAVNSSLSGSRFGMDLVYGLGPVGNGQLSVLAGGAVQSLTGGDRQMGYVGVRYGWQNGVNLDLTVGQTDVGDTTMAFALRFDLGRKPHFGARDTRGLFPAY
ncbi:hypothetical protein VK792_04275 [Mesobacterium sp. TK19101]|uniref:Porin n=1 Tax=Mesobacterium hydrothermale TaxID=3111907 RepID=A0ABU6HDG2_9RHOB|nr:hypothetical protein [Mesobacterium sp. TK19101]MEC3860490.1 hypothetical protein [Mesobacterium sp. TK19101]